MHILGLDLGTVCGAADGLPGTKPNIWTWNLEDAGQGRAARFALWQMWLKTYFLEDKMGADDPREVRVFYEQPLTLAAIIQMTQRPSGALTNDDTITFHRGLVGILEAVAFNAGIRHIEAVDVFAARKALSGKARPKDPKAYVYSHCKLLGWQCANTNESDACAVWAYGAAKSNPRLAHLSTPLFGR